MKKNKELRTFDLNKPFNPEDIKGLNIKELERLSDDIKQNIVDSCAKNGGHLARSLGATDLTVALHHYFNLPKKLFPTFGILTPKLSAIVAPISPNVSSISN